MIVVLEGKMGSGTTISAVALAILERNRSGRKIVSNIKLKEIEYKHISLEDLFGFMSTDFLIDASLILDDAYMIMDSRNSQSKLNKLFSYLIARSRRSATDIYITTQNITYLDVRVRNACDIRGHCRYTKRTNNCSINMIDKEGMRQKIMLDLSDFFMYVDGSCVGESDNEGLSRIVKNIKFAAEHP